MIAQIVFDLPLDGPFDYLVPDHLIPAIVPGTRVRVPFGPRIQTGYVVGLLEHSDILRIKSIQSPCDASALFNNDDLTFAKDFAAYYGCSLGEALAAILRNKEGHGPSIRKDHKPVLSLYTCRPDSYALKIREIMEAYHRQSFLILVPDSFRAEILSQQLKGAGPFRIGTRSSVFECDGRSDCVIMVDDEDPSYKQEQMPMYETRQVLMARSHLFGFDVAFVGVSPSVELVGLVNEGRVKLIEEQAASVPAVRPVDLSNYKFVPGLLSPPVLDALSRALKAGKTGILVLNRRGTYRLTRCTDCAEILKCSHCDSPLIYSRSEGKYLCRHCTFTLPADTDCPKCRKPSWRSQGIGVEQVQTELKKHFSQAKILAFERVGRDKTAGQSLADFDILISTSAVLRFQGTLKAQMGAFIDFDAELNRLDMRSAFNAFSLVRHISSMVSETVFIQTRNSSHYVLQNLSNGKTKEFYVEELKLRQEFGFSPFKHWIKISWRGKSEKAAKEAAQQAFNALSETAPKNFFVTPPLADAVGRKRDQFRFNVMVQSDHVPPAVAFIKSTLQKIKRPSRIIVTMNIDP